MATCFVIRSVDYDGGRAGKVWVEHVCLNRAAADRRFAQMSMPRVYGSGSRTRLEEYEPYTPGDVKPVGLVKMVCCKFAMMVVEMCELPLEE